MCEDLKFKTFTIVFTKSKKSFAIGSRLIMWWLKKDYSHVARKLSVHNNQVTIYYQASEGKVNYECEEVFNTKHKIIKSYGLCIESSIFDKIGVECLRDSGKKYGFIQNIGIVLVKLGFYDDNPWKDGRNCSELIYVTVFKQLIPELNYNPDIISPTDIEDIILQYMEQQPCGNWKLKSSL